MPILLKAKGKCTTDHISMAGPWLKYRGHLENISREPVLGAVNVLTGVAGEGKDQPDGSTRSFPDIARHWPHEAGQPWQGSSATRTGVRGAPERSPAEPCFGAPGDHRAAARIHEANPRSRVFQGPGGTYDPTRSARTTDQPFGLADLPPAARLTACCASPSGTEILFLLQPHDVRREHRVVPGRVHHHQLGPHPGLTHPPTPTITVLRRRGDHRACAGQSGGEGRSPLFGLRLPGMVSHGRNGRRRAASKPGPGVASPTPHLVILTAAAVMVLYAAPAVLVAGTSRDRTSIAGPPRRSPRATTGTSVPSPPSWAPPDPHDAGSNPSTSESTATSRTWAYRDGRLYSAHGPTIPLLLVPSELAFGTSPPNWVITLVAACAGVACRGVDAGPGPPTVPVRPSRLDDGRRIAASASATDVGGVSVGNGYEAAVAVGFASA